MTADIHFGIDIGGSGIKGAPVDVTAGVLVAPRFELPTPPGAEPAAVRDCVTEILDHFDWPGPFGCTFPAVVKAGFVRTAANVSQHWVGMDLTQELDVSRARQAVVLNDADAAGLAEMRFGAGRGASGTTLLLTLGTGIGSALFVDGTLVPNTELGHVPLHGGDAEAYAAASVRTREHLDYPTWAARLEEFLRLVTNLLWPDLVILGGGVSRDADAFISLLAVDCPVVAAALHNDAGIVGAALAAHAAG